ncbi:MAG: DUF4984 domain-containing protein [Candidatus Cryptobacteroides sp.]
MMNKIISYISLAALVLSVCVGCREDYITYSGAEYVMFADTLSVRPVQKDVDWFTVPVVSTVACSYDRTVAVEIIDAGSDAIEGYHYRLESNTVTIPAGQTRTDVRVHGYYDRMDGDTPLTFNLSLVMPDVLEMPLYGRATKVMMRKVGPFDINDFVGDCVVTSLFLYYYSLDSSYQRLIRTEIYPSMENTIVCRNFLYDGYDILMTFDPEDPLNPVVTVPEGQVMSDEASVFGIVYGDNRILISDSTSNTSYFNSLGKYAEVWIRVYVENLGDLFGVVGQYYNVMEWISEEEADRLHREEGM